MQDKAELRELILKGDYVRELEYAVEFEMNRLIERKGRAHHDEHIIRLMAGLESFLHEKTAVSDKEFLAKLQSLTSTRLDDMRKVGPNTVMLAFDVASGRVAQNEVGQPVTLAAQKMVAKFFECLAVQKDAVPEYVGEIARQVRQIPTKYSYNKKHFAEYAASLQEEMEYLGHIKPFGEPQSLRLPLLQEEYKVCRQLLLATLRDGEPKVFGAGKWAAGELEPMADREIEMAAKDLGIVLPGKSMAKGG